MAFGKRQGKPVTVTVKSFGEDIELRLRPLSALEVDGIRNAYPPPVAPRRQVDGSTVIDDKDADYQRQLNAWVEQFFALKVCRMIGSAEFEATDALEQTRQLKADFTETEFVALIATANKVGTGDITAQHTEAARAALVPFGSDQPEA